MAKIYNRFATDVVPKRRKAYSYFMSKITDSFENQPLNGITIISLPCLDSVTLSGVRYHFLKKAALTYFDGQECRTIKGPVNFEIFFRDRRISGRQLIHLFAHLALGLIRRETGEDTEERIIVPRRRHPGHESAKIVFNNEFNDPWFIDQMTFLWRCLMEAINPKSHFTFPTLDEADAYLEGEESFFKRCNRTHCQCGSKQCTAS